MTAGTDRKRKPGGGAGAALALAGLSLAAALLAASPAHALPKENLCQRRAAAGKDFGQCMKEEKQALKKLKNRYIAPDVKEFCESVSTTIEGKSHALMLQCVEDLERRTSGGAGKGGGRRR